MLAARTAAEPAINLGGAVGSLRHGLRAAFYTPHPGPPFCERQALYPTEPASARGGGASPDRTSDAGPHAASRMVRMVKTPTVWHRRCERCALTASARGSPRPRGIQVARIH